MKRKKWSELEEQTLLTKYSDLQTSGTLSKLKTREKKFKPIADHLNTLHHFQDPSSFPFKWSWRDVSIKIQNMRHQYLGVKQKIRINNSSCFNWSDGDIHWVNFDRYKQVFGDVHLSDNVVVSCRNNYDDDDDDEEEDGEDGVVEEVLEMGNLIVRREERKREREWRNENEVDENETRRKEREIRLRERVYEKEVEFEGMRIELGKREVEKRVRFDEERRRRMEAEERWEEEEMEWRERMIEMQIEHEKRMMVMQAEACQNQMQVLGVVGRLFCQFFGVAGGDGLGNLNLGQQVLEEGSGGGKNDGSSILPSEFL